MSFFRSVSGLSFFPPSWGGEGFEDWFSHLGSVYLFFLVFYCHVFLKRGTFHQHARIKCHPMLPFITWGFPEQIWPALSHRQAVSWVLLNARIRQKCKIKVFSSKKYSIYMPYYAVPKEIKCNT